MCNHLLGISTIQINIAGCPWSETYEQNTFQKLYNGIPAHFIEIQVIEIKGDPDPENNNERSRIEAIWDFFQGESRFIQTKDLLETSIKAESINEGIDDITNGADNTGMIDSIQASENQSSQQSETVRFQYDGILKMDVSTIGGDNLQCTNYTRQMYDPSMSQSFHVVDYMATFSMEIALKYELIPGTLFCNKVDTELHRIQIESNVGMDTNAGFAKFYANLGKNEQNILSACSVIAPPQGTADGACIIAVNNDEDDFSGQRNVTFFAGRPEPFSTRHTKYVNIKIIFGYFGDVSAVDSGSADDSVSSGTEKGGAKTKGGGGLSKIGRGAGTGGRSAPSGPKKDVKHRAEFFIVGLYSKGNGQSFALPTYEPIMVLRDPPGKSLYSFDI